MYRLQSPRTLTLRLGLVIALLATGLTSSVAHAQQTPVVPLAYDGRHLLREPAEVQALFRAVWGANAEARWVAEHNVFLAGGQPLGGPRIAFVSSSASAAPTVPATTDALVDGLRS